MREGVDERGWGDERGGDEKEEGMMRKGSDERGGPWERERGDSLRLTLGDTYPGTDTKYIQVTNVKGKVLWFNGN